MVARFEGTLRPPFGVRDAGLLVADVELTVDDGAPVSRRARGACLLVTAAGEAIALDLREAELSGCARQTRRGVYGELEAEWADLLADVAPGPGVPAELTIERLRAGETVVVEGAPVTTPAADDYRKARIARVIVARIRPRDVARAAQVRPPASPPSTSAGGAAGRAWSAVGGQRVRVAWLSVVAALGAVAWLVQAVFARAPAHPSVVRSGRLMLASLALASFFALVRVCSIPNDGAPWPGLGLVPELIADKARRTLTADLLGVSIAATFGSIAALSSGIILMKLARAGDVLLRERPKYGRPGMLLVDELTYVAVGALLAVAALGIVLWVARRRGARTVATLLGQVAHGEAPPLATWVVLEGTLEGVHPPAEVAVYQRRVTPGKPSRRGETVSERPMVLAGEFGRARVPMPGVTWGSTFASHHRDRATSVFKQWIPQGARVVVAGRLERSGDELSFRTGGLDAIVAFATAQERSPRALLRARLWLHHATLAASVAALAYLVAALH